MGYLTGDTVIYNKQHATVLLMWIWKWFYYHPILENCLWRFLQPRHLWQATGWNFFRMPMEFQGVQVWVEMGNTADQRPSTNETDFENHEMKRDSKFGSAIHPYLGVNIHSPGTTVPWCLIMFALTLPFPSLHIPIRNVNLLRKYELVQELDLCTVETFAGTFWWTAKYFLDLASKPTVSYSIMTSIMYSLGLSISNHLVWK